jgi:diacylglycerol kinase family enzyme
MKPTVSVLPATADRVVVAYNPNAGASSAKQRIDRLVDLLRKEGLETEVQTDLDQVAKCANAWHAQGRLRALVGVGGDGTAAELVNRTEQGVPITVLPAGTENLLAGYFHFGQSPESCAKTIAAGRSIRVDAGCASGRIFLLMASCGFDADVVRRLHSQRKGHIHHSSYLKPILDSIRSYPYPELRVYLDDLAGATEAEAPPLSARWLFAFNLPRYGGGFQIAPQADGADGLLDICAFSGGDIWHGLQYASAVLLGMHQELADCTIRRVRRLRITSEGEAPYQLDGDPGGVLPLDITVLPGRLTLVVPPEE